MLNGFSDNPADEANHFPATNDALSLPLRIPPSITYSLRCWSFIFPTDIADPIACAFERVSLLLLEQDL